MVRRELEGSKGRLEKVRKRERKRERWRRRRARISAPNREGCSDGGPEMRVGGRWGKIEHLFL